MANKIFEEYLKDVIQKEIDKNFPNIESNLLANEVK